MMSILEGELHTRPTDLDETEYIRYAIPLLACEQNGVLRRAP